MSIYFANDSEKFDLKISKIRIVRGAGRSAFCDPHIVQQNEDASRGSNASSPRVSREERKQQCRRGVVHVKTQQANDGRRKVSTKEIPAKAPLAKDPTEDQRQKKCGDEQSPMKESKGKTRIAHQIHSRSREDAQSNRTPAKDPVTRELMALEIRSAPQMNGVEQKNGEGKKIWMKKHAPPTLSMQAGDHA
ncbi:hypothetical protein C8R44DRAFT_747961 [Mycena epipterygia]|nr:hypothetical protein C8R44DRAFT_747961 [Mycena epipterygia]